MSGNNPHGHLSQPQNSSWNPLQIPSYIPRQPQLAHMSNERPMVRSPLAWHTPTPPESLYNFISANHKNLEQLNPLLPSFVRGPSPFDSMDLSLQSNRNSSSPLTKGLSGPVPPDFGHKPPPPPPPASHTQNNFPIHNLSTNSNVHHSQSMSSGPPPPPPLSKYLNSNGNDVDMQQQACGLYIRDTDRINDDYAKMASRSCENDIQANMTKPVELVKECTYTNLSNKLHPNSPKKLSPPHSQQHQQQQLQHQQQQPYSNNGPASPDNNRLTHLTNFNAPHNHMLSESATSGTCLPPKCGTDLTTATVIENSCNSVSTNDSPANVTSNEDSVDSSGSRTRRKRKPNKTVRMSHDSEDENVSLGELVHKQDKSSPPLLPVIAEAPGSNGSHSMISDTVSAHQNQPENVSYSDHRIDKETIEPEGPQSPSPPPIEKPQVITETIDLRSSTESEENFHQPDIKNNSQMRRRDSDDVETIDKIAEMIAKSSGSNRTIDFDDPSMSSCSNGNKTTIPVPASPVVINDDDDDVDRSPVRAKQGPRTPDAIVDKLSIETATNNANDLKSIFETSSPSSPVDAIQPPLPTSPAAAQPPPPPLPPAEEEEQEKATIEEKVASPPKPTETAKTTFEEVEYKLEEMFAGIEDEPATVSAVPVEDTANSEVTTDLSLALALPTNNKIKDDEEDDEDSEHKPLSSLASTSNITQKRSHSTPKNEPAKKRARLTKKASNKKIKGRTSTSSAASANKTSITQGNKSKGNGNGGSGSAGNSAKSVAAKVEELLPTITEPKLKGPYILVKPDGTINVINAPIAEEDPEKMNKIKKGPNTHVDRSKIRGIHMSTLGNKYDAETADATWMCVFCKKGPHKFGLGDLFGPYIITTKCEEFESAQRNDGESEFTSRRKKSEMFQKTPHSLPAVPASVAHTSSSNVNNKKKKKLSESHPYNITEKTPEDRFFGMSKVSDTSYEVWMHEDCSVWAPGVFLIGARIVGLENSVWSSTNYTCNVCSQKGAIVCCLQRGCGEKAHIPCARLSSWDLNENDFKTYCEKHAQTLTTSS